MYEGLSVGCTRYTQISACSQLKIARPLLLSIGLQRNSNLRTEDIQSFPSVRQSTLWLEEKKSSVRLNSFIPDGGTFFPGNGPLAHYVICRFPIT